MSVYAPPIKNRHYIKPTKNAAGNVTRHTCSRCNTDYPVKERGVWFELVERRDVWAWVCKACCQKRGLWQEWY